MQIKKPQIKNMVSSHDLSHSRLTTFNMGELIPILAEEIYPGDTWQVETESLLRLPPLATACMHPIDVTTHFFFVPWRLIWDDAEDFITGGEDGDDTSALPFRIFSSISAGDLADHLGNPLVSSSRACNILPFRAYQTIYNEWYRQQTIQTAVTVSKASGEDTTTSIQVRKRNWAKDYYTNCLIAPQLGDEVSLPLGTSADLSGTAWVKGIGVDSAVSSVTASEAVKESDGTTPTYSYAHQPSTTDEIWVEALNDSAPYTPQIRADLSNVTADLSTASSATINELRSAMAIQRFLERNARCGSRYAEWIPGHFGVDTLDMRLNRPEFLGGGKSTISFSDIIQTSESGTTKQGTVTGYGLSAQQTHGFKKSFTEHGWLIGIMSVMPDNIYQEGHRKQLRRYQETRYDLLVPSFWNLGDQAVLNSEVQVSHTSPSETFGYAPRFEEFRHIPSTVHGEMRDSLDSYHLARQYSGDVSLNSAFLECTPDTRIFAVETAEQCQVHLVNKIQALRPLPRIAEPSI
jgi:hypothetical protein